MGRLNELEEVAVRFATQIIGNRALPHYFQEDGLPGMDDNSYFSADNDGVAIAKDAYVVDAGRGTWAKHIMEDAFRLARAFIKESNEWNRSVRTEAWERRGDEE